MHSTSKFYFGSRDMRPRIPRVAIHRVERRSRLDPLHERGPTKIPGAVPMGTTCASVFSLSLFFLSHSLLLVFSRRRLPFRSRPLRSCGFRSRSVVLGMPRVTVVRLTRRGERKASRCVTCTLSSSGRAGGRKKARPRFPASIHRVSRRAETEYLPPAGRTCSTYRVSPQLRATPNTRRTLGDGKCCGTMLQTSDNFLQQFRQ